MPIKKKSAKKSKKPIAKKKVLAIPKHYRAVTPFLTVHDAAGAISWYLKAFGARELSRMPMPSGKLAHAEVRIGDSVVMLADEDPTMGSRSAQTMGGSPAGLVIYTKDVDTAFAKATAAGAKVVMPVSDMFWGDRYGQLQDPYGFKWSIVTHKKDMTPKQMVQAQNEFFAQQKKPAAE